MWLYNNKVVESIEDFGDNPPFGFIYITTHIPTGKQYLGKKSLYHNIKKKLGKKELALLPTLPGRKPTTKKIIKESDWKTYYGSEDFIKAKIKDKKHEEFSREIIQLVENKKLLTYFECKYLFKLGILEPENGENWLNNNILGKFFKKDFAS